MSEVTLNALECALDEAQALRMQVDALQAENAKLRERIHELEMEGADHFYRTAYAEDANRTLEAENAKLRELVRWMYYRMDESCAVQHPYAPAPINYDQLMQAAVRARELGVEVS